MNQEGNFGTAKGQEGEEMEKCLSLGVRNKRNTGKQTFGIDLKLK